jgi:hypothetical protein
MQDVVKAGPFPREHLVSENIKEHLPNYLMMTLCLPFYLLLILWFVCFKQILRPIRQPAVARKRHITANYPTNISVSFRAGRWYDHRAPSQDLNKPFSFFFLDRPHLLSSIKLQGLPPAARSALQNYVRKEQMD